MRLATRLVLMLGATVTVAILIYALVSLRQREALLKSGFVRETEILAKTLQVVANNAVRDGRYADLHRVLAEVTEDPNTVASIVFNQQRTRIAGAGETGSRCLRQILVSHASGGYEGWVECGGSIRWIAVPVISPAAALLVARRPATIEEEIRATGNRLLWLTFVLVLATAAVILLVLRRSLALPLAELQRGISLVRQGDPVQIETASAPGEFSAVARAFQEMADELAAGRAALEHEAAERAELDRRFRESEKFALVGRLSGGLAHELGSPLSVISVRAELLAVPGITPEKAAEHGVTILGEVDRISQLIRGLLHIARRHGVERERVDLNAVIRAVLAHVKPFAEGAGVALEAELPAGPLWVLGQATLLRHMVINVVRNGIQALAGHSGERTLTTSARQDEQGTEIVVQDSGPGMDAATFARVFEPFFTTKEIGEGTGLGLSVSRGIAEEHGGELRLELPPGGGVRAVFNVPNE